MTNINDDKFKNEQSSRVYDISISAGGDVLSKSPDLANTETTKYSTIKRMLNTLDKFLAKKFMFVIAFCTAVISMCTVGLAFANTSFGSASSGGAGTKSSGNLTLNTWLFSLIAVFAFIAIVTLVYVMGRKKAFKKNNA